MLVAVREGSKTLTSRSIRQTGRYWGEITEVFILKCACHSLDMWELKPAWMPNHIYKIVQEKGKQGREQKGKRTGSEGKRNNGKRREEGRRRNRVREKGKEFESKGKEGNWRGRERKEGQ